MKILPEADFVLYNIDFRKYKIYNIIRKYILMNFAYILGSDKMKQNRRKVLIVTIFTLGAMVLMSNTTSLGNNSAIFKSNATSTEIEEIHITEPVLTAKLAKKRLKLSWSEVEGAKKYKIYRSNQKNGKYKKIGEVKADTLKFSDKNFEGERKTYYYKIKAISKSDGKKERIYSNIIKKTVYKRKSIVNGITYIDGILIANKTYKLPASYNPGTNPTAYNAFKKMQSDAYKDGISLYIASGFRSYSYQQSLYNSYVARDGQALADTYSARAGYSEHQTGLAFDINNPSSSFDNTREAKWLAQNCAKYGFIIRYQKSKEQITGYKYESWHIRYLGNKLAKKVTKSGKCLEEYLGITSKYK